MIKSTIVFWLYSLLFFLTFSTISADFIDRKIGANIASTGKDIYPYIAHNDYYKKYESLISQLKEVLKILEFAEKINQQPKPSQEQLDNIQESWIEFAKFNNDQSKFDIEKVFSKKSSSVRKIELKNIISKINGDMTDRLNEILRFELVKSLVQTRVTIRALSNTCDLIKDSKQFRESTELQLATTQSKEYLDKAEHYYKTANDEINRIESTSDILIESNTLKEIAFNLKSAKVESDCAQQVLNNITNDIYSKLESLSSARKNHVSNRLISLGNLFITIIEFLNTPTVILTKIGRLLFATNAVVHTVNAFGHARGIYWTDEEINKLKEHQLQLDKLKIQIKNSFDKINDRMEKLEKIKQFSQISFDYTDYA